MTRRATAIFGGSVDIRDVRPVELVCFALCVAHVVYLVASFLSGVWLIDAQGRGIPTDFVNVWAAGRLVLDGHAAAAYDWTIHKQAEVAAVGHEFVGYFGWHYPPPFLFVAAVLALLPYAAAYALWLALTFPLYVAAVWRIVGDRVGIVFACAFPAVLSNLVVGQNGFLTTALLGGALTFLEKRPVLAGCCLGLLTYKPHFGILFPLVLVAGGCWRVFWTAAAVATLLAIASWISFGAGTWEAFLQSISQTSHAFLSEGRADWSKLQSLFGLVRALGGGETTAWSLQGLLTAAAALAACAAWRSHLPFEIKAATVAIGALLATPYLYLYDLVVLAIPLAFLARLWLKGVSPGELVVVGVACLLIVSFPFVKAPVGLAATMLIALVVARRAMQRPVPDETSPAPA